MFTSLKCINQLIRYFVLCIALTFSFQVVAQDECDRTAECQAIWGPTANDCFNSRSSTSVCMCGTEACSTVFGNVNSPPSASFSSPNEDESFDAGELIYVQVIASDLDGSVANVRLSVDGVFVRQENVDPYQWGNNSNDSVLSSLSEGEHTLTAVVTDNEGATITISRSISVGSSVTPTPTPTPVPTATATPEPVDGAPSVSFDTPNNGAVFTEGDDVYVNVLAADDDGISNVRLSVNGQFVRQENVFPYEWGNNSNDSVLIDIAPGTYQLSAVATDNNGETTTQSITISVEENNNVASGDCSIGGTLQQWHRVELLCEGPSASESNDATFTDYRFDVTFSQGSTVMVVPGHFAADGNAAETSAISGNKWRAYFSPPNTGIWNYDISFRSGSDIASDDNNGTSVSELDGANGTFSVSASNANDTSMRSRGLLSHRDGERYLRFADDSVYIQGGMDSPENIFGYFEFDNTIKYDNAGSCKGILHEFAAHEDDWNSGDPTWQGRGHSLIGLVNYVASQGVNSIYIMMNTVSGDGCDAHPWSTYNSSGEVKSFDVSKLDQWEIVLDHMTENGILIHAMTQETENDQLLNNGDLGTERKLYYRELISRFGHHPALKWNLGEENTNTTAQRQAYSDFIRSTDPYDHPILMHTYPGQYYHYDGLLGHDSFDGPSIQVSNISSDASANGDGVYGMATEWLANSESAGKQWLITFSEASGSNAPTPFDEVSSLQRIHWMWASVMSGGAGFEWYLKNNGVGHAYDLAVEDLREFDQYWEQTGYLVSFFRDTVQAQYGIDLQDLEQDNDVTSTNSDWVLSDPGSAYIIFLREGGSTELNLPNNSTYRALWFNPRSGAYTTGGTLTGPGNESIGNPPNESSEDWVVLVTPEGNSAATPNTASEYVEQDGLVVIEVENTASDLDLWEFKTDVSGYTGSGYLEFTGNTPINGSATSPLEYTFTVNQSGLYYLNMFVARETLVIDGETRTDIANDAYVRLDGNYGEGPNVGDEHGDDAPLSSLQSNTKFYGGNDLQFIWSYGNRLDLGGSVNKRVAVYDLYAGEEYTFVMSGRSQLFKVDRVVFQHESVAGDTARQLSQTETLN